MGSVRGGDDGWVEFNGFPPDTVTVILEELLVADRLSDSVDKAKESRKNAPLNKPE